MLPRGIEMVARKIEIPLKDSCNHCTPKLQELEQIFDDFENGKLPAKDMKLTLELTSDWLGETIWHLNKVTIKERKIKKKSLSTSSCKG